MLRIGNYAQLKHAYEQLSTLCAINVAHRGFLKGRETAGDDDEVEGFLMAPTTVWMKSKGLSMQSGMLTAGHRSTLCVPCTCPNGPPSSSVNASTRVTASKVVGGEAPVAFWVWGKRVGQDIRRKSAS